MMENSECFDILISDFDEHYFKVDFPGRFNQKMLDAVRAVPGRIWKCVIIANGRLNAI